MNSSTTKRIRNHAESSKVQNSSTYVTLHDHVARTIDDYFNHLDGECVTDVYRMVITQTERALFRSIMKRMNNNQTKAAHCLGISRGTLLKKLTQYKLRPDKKRSKI